MGQKLLIVESPTKARTITRMLGKDFKIMASMGHVRDLPEHAFGVDVDRDFQPEYVDTPRSKKIVSDLKAAAKSADEIYLAPDPDREGEAIAWHLQEVLKKGFKGSFRRVSFHEITKTAILRALEHGGDIDLNLVDAQQARRVLDRVVGYKVSPLLWSQIAKGASAGRVQSVALRLIVERERAILAFIPEEYWNFEMRLASEAGDEFIAKLFKIDGANFKIPNEATALACARAIENGSGFTVDAIERSERKRYAQPPFTTSTLQQAANQQLRFTASFTMKQAQSLYEGVDIGAGGATGLITYMRTDSVNIAREAQEACLGFIRSAYGAEYVPAKPNFYKSKGNAQEAHEAVRPTDVTRTPESLAPYLESAQLKLYTLIWRRFVASQMPPARLELLTVDVDTLGSDGRRYTGRANASRMLFAGFTLVYNDQDKNDEATAKLAMLGKLREQEPCRLLELLKEQKFTEPPPRYSEAALIKELEENGIGRPSTYATIIRTIQDRKYVGTEHGKLFPTELGCTVTDYLVASLPSLFEVEFTSKMEQELDAVEAGERNWTAMMREFYDRFAAWLEAAKNVGAPTEDEAGKLLRLFESVKFPPPPEPVTPTRSKRKPRTDENFVESVRENFAESGKLSARQFEALSKIAAKYVDQNPALAEFAPVIDPEILAREKAALAVDWSPVFTALSKVTFEEPVNKGKKKGFDDKKFFDSFKRQLNSGKALSERQLAVLRRIAEKYAAQIENAEAVMAHFDQHAPSTSGAPLTPEAQQAQAQANRVADDDIGFLSGITGWAAPVQRNRRTYDDKAFFESLVEQRNGGRKLSDKQVAALHKMAEKYRKKAEA